MTKTNAVRMLEKAGISFEVLFYDFDPEDLNGLHAAEHLHIAPEFFYKTLVLISNKNELFVCCLPVSGELDLKKAANAFGAKSLSMLPVKELLSKTGYIRGGCSPVGMKKQLPTIFSDKVLELDEVYFSGGARGCAVKIPVDKALSFVNAKTADILL